MALQIGDKNAVSGMSKSIFDELERQLSSGMTSKDLDNVRPSWQKLAFAIATGVIEHITANVEIFGIQTQGNVNATVQGNTGLANPGNHQHNVNLSGQANNIVFTQNNDGTGHVR